MTRSKPFEKMRAVRAYKRRHLHCLQKVEDFCLVEEIGFFQERGHPISLTQLYTLGLASSATVQRRIKKLREVGAIVPTKSVDDRRVVRLILSPTVYKAYSGYARLLAAARPTREKRA